jgi:curved DNA-binding protein CbpA
MTQSLKHEGASPLEHENYYKLLEVREDATSEEIRVAYERAIHETRAESLAGYSLVPDEEVEAEIQRISHAYMQLANPVSRKAHDRRIAAQREQQIMPPPPASVKLPPSPASPDSKVIYLRPQGAALESEPKAAAVTPESDAKTMSLQEMQNSLAHIRRGKLLSVRQKNLQSEQSVQQFLAALGEARIFNGNVLSQIRRLREVSLDELAEVTFVRASLLQAIEEEDFKSFVAEVYLKGHLQSYARALNLPVTEVTEDYLELYRQGMREKG